MKIPSSILRNLIILVLSAGLVLVTQVARYSSAANPPSLDNKYTDLLRNNKDFNSECGEARERTSLSEALSNPITRTIEKYHEVTNCFFNKRIKVMVKKMLKEDVENKPLLLFPPPQKFDENDQALGREKCKGKGEDINLSTYCLADAAVKEYFEFRQAMQEARRLAEVEAVQKKFELETAGSEEGKDELHGEFFGLGDVSRLSRRLRSLGGELNRIDKEIELGRQALDQALSAYNELQMALPLHRKYLEVIGGLEEYRDKVSDIRKEVDLYPVTFLDVTTTQCT